VKYLVEKKAEINFAGRTPLNVAIQEGHFEIAIHLIENGANFDTADCFGRTPLQMVAIATHDSKYHDFFNFNTFFC